MYCKLCSRNGGVLVLDVPNGGTQHLGPCESYGLNLYGATQPNIDSARKRGLMVSISFTNNRPIDAFLGVLS